MNCRPTIRLIDGPLLDTKSYRATMIEAMANDLARAGTAGNEIAAMRTLRQCGYAMADVVMLVDDARNLAKP